MDSQADHVAALIARYPRLFRGRMPECGISVGAGWAPLLMDLFGAIDRLLGDSDAALFRVEQIKEKFAGLRVYFSVAGSAEMTFDLISSDGVQTVRKPPKAPGEFPREALDRLIADAAARARTTCERCGNPGEKRPGRWIQVLCDACHARLLAERRSDE